MFCEPDGDFPNHHPDPVVEANMQALMARVKEEKADLGIGLDGDADRLGIVDPDGRLLFGDEVLSLYARELLTRKPGSTVIADVKCSSRLFNDIKAHGGTPMMWTTGHSIIKAKMRKSALRSPVKCPATCSLPTTGTASTTPSMARPGLSPSSRRRTSP